MALNTKPQEETKPQEDAKEMHAEYVKGTTISFLAQRYGYTEQEVYDMVVREAVIEPLVTQASLDKTAEAGK